MIAYIVGSCRCGQCGDMLTASDDFNGPRPGSLYVYCANPKCAEYGIRYNPPTFSLEARAKAGEAA